ncbi:MAG TPA: IPT/TIG domain-containing protein [Terracidiphilus sp.]|nr:IPT/TIG domain-containing protein [Terracidiphilus sp.]
MFVPVSIRLRTTGLHSLALALLTLAFLALAPTTARAGGPKYIAGVSFFNPGVLGQPLNWSGGQLNYYVDQGPLNASVSNQQATAMVDAAAALWSAVTTAAVTLTDKGPLNEDVSGANILVNSAGQIAQPSDVTPTAAAYPLAVIYDADGSVIDAVFGATASQPTSCQNNSVFVWMDNLNPDATIAHAVILLNGLCATNADLLAMMSYQLERAFGRVLGLDYSQVNPGALISGDANSLQGWPIMQPLSGVCGQAGGECIPNPAVLRFDDIAALNRIYPITAQNLTSFPGKQLTAPNTVSIQGAITFRTGVGMQGVNVVARPLDANGNPLYQYTVTFVSGAYFSGNHGNPVTGFTNANPNASFDSTGVPFTQWGSNDPALQGYFDLSGIPLPPGMTTANYQVTFESINPLYILTNAVGPYAAGQVAPSGTLQSISVPNLSAGSSQTLAVTVPDSAVGGYQDSIGTQPAPRPMPAGGLWVSRLSQIGQTDWFTFPVRGKRTFTVVTQALDETGAPTESKALPSIGVWDAFDPIGSTAIGAAPGLNGFATGETWLRVSSTGDDIVRIGIADLRGDGRPDYAYNGWVLYADTVQPARLPASGGPIVIHGMGFRLADTVLVNGQPALVTSISPNEVTAIAPAAAPGVTGSVDVEVDDLPIFYAATVITGGISYDSGSGDALTLVTAPANTVPMATPIPFTVTALGPDLTPAAGVTVLYTVTSGPAILACGLPICAVTATGDGRATINVTATNEAWSIVTASLSNGSSLQAHFAGGTPPVLSSLTPQLSLAAGATFTWTVQALVLFNGLPAANQSVTWAASATGIVSNGSAAVLTNSGGIATRTLTVGPLAEGQTATISACLNGTSQCVAYTAYGARPEYAYLQPISGTTQTLVTSAAPAPIALRLLDMNGNPMAGGAVALYQALYAWAPPCAPHTVCPPSTLLATQTATAVSALDGTVTFSPAALPGVATSLQAIAASGNTAAVSIVIEQH